MATRSFLLSLAISSLFTSTASAADPSCVSTQKKLTTTWASETHCFTEYGPKSTNKVSTKSYTLTRFPRLNNVVISSAGPLVTRTETAPAVVETLVVPTTTTSNVLETSTFCAVEGGIPTVATTIVVTNTEYSSTTRTFYETFTTQKQQITSTVNLPDTTSTSYIPTSPGFVPINATPLPRVKGRRNQLSSPLIERGSKQAEVKDDGICRLDPVKGTFGNAFKYPKKVTCLEEVKPALIIQTLCYGPATTSISTTTPHQTTTSTTTITLLSTQTTVTTVLTPPATTTDYTTRTDVLSLTFSITLPTTTTLESPPTTVTIQATATATGYEACKRTNMFKNGSLLSDDASRADSCTPNTLNFVSVSGINSAEECCAACQRTSDDGIDVGDCGGWMFSEYPWGNSCNLVTGQTCAAGGAVLVYDPREPAGSPDRPPFSDATFGNGNCGFIAPGCKRLRYGIY